MAVEFTLLKGHTLQQESARLGLPLPALTKACQIADPNLALSKSLTIAPIGDPETLANALSQLGSTSASSAATHGSALKARLQALAFVEFKLVVDEGLRRPPAQMKAPPGVQRPGTEHTHLSPGVVVTEVANSALDPAISIDQLALAASCSAKLGVLDTDVRLLVTSGSIRAKINGQDVTLGRGDVLRAGKESKLEITSEGPAEIAFVSTPRKFWKFPELAQREKGRPRTMMQTPSGLYAAKDAPEFFKDVEKCHVSPVANHPDDPAASLVRVRVAADGQTSLHALEVDERYIVTGGRGLMQLGEKTFEVGPGDIVLIPKGTSQNIRNLGDGELEFYCACTPRFLKDDYIHVG